jgi:hypothetical protein
VYRSAERSDRATDRFLFHVTSASVDLNDRRGGGQWLVGPEAMIGHDLGQLVDSNPFSCAIPVSKHYGYLSCCSQAILPDQIVAEQWNHYCFDGCSWRISVIDIEAIGSIFSYFTELPNY